MKIVDCTIGPMPAPGPRKLGAKNPEVTVTFEDGTGKTLFSFSPNEISFQKDEIVGKTEDEVLELKSLKGMSYARR